MLDLRGRRAKSPFAFATAHPRARAASIRIARRLRLAGHNTIGLIPAGRCSVSPVAALVAGALVELCGTRVAMVDLRTAQGSRVIPEGRSRKNNDGGRSERLVWVAEKLAAIGPTRDLRAGESIASLAAILARCRDRFAHTLVDLGGLWATGELPAAIALIDAAVVVVRIRQTRERDLLQLGPALAGGRIAGAICIRR